MSPRAQEEGGRNGRTVMVAAAIGLLAIGVVLIARAKPRTEVLDPAAAGRTGSRYLAEMLRSFDNEVMASTMVPEPGQNAQRMLVLVDRLSPKQRAATVDWVREGGVLVMADQRSSLAFDRRRGTPTSLDLARGTCTLQALARLGSLKLTDWNPQFKADETVEGDATGLGDATTFATNALGTGCFGASDGEFVHAEPEGAGTIISLGDNWVLSNQLIDEGDNAAMARALLAPTDRSKVLILRGTSVDPTVAIEGGGDKSLTDLVPRNVWMSIVGVIVAAALFAIARGWRTGRPVIERPAVPIEASDLVVSTGNLMHRAGHASRAAELLRYQLHRDLCARFGMAPRTPIEQVDRTVAERTGRLVGGVFHALQPTQLTTSAELADLAARIRTIRKELL